MSPLRLAAGAVALVTVTAVSVAAAAPLNGPARVSATAWRVDPPTYIDAPPEERAARELVELVNEVRRDGALPDVTWEPRLYDAAQGHAEYMASVGRLTHLGAGGSDTGDRLVEAGFRWLNWGENVGSGFKQPGPLLDAWIDSGDHYQHLIADFRYAGAGVAATPDGTPYWVLVLAS